LSESEQLEDLSDLRSQVVNTSDSDHKDDSRFSGNVERTSSSSFSSELDGFLFFSDELLVVTFGSLGVFSNKRHPFQKGGDWGSREEAINQLVANML